MTTTELLPVSEEPQFEVLPPEVKSASTELSCPSSKAMELYQPFAKPFENAAALLAEEDAATAATDARALRLKMVKARTTITATKNESKADIKLAGNIIDWYHAKGRDRLAAAEARLLEIEKAEEHAEAARIEALREERAETLDSMGHVSHGVNLGTMAEADWKEYLQQAKDLHELRELREAKAKEEAEAKAKQEAEEREAQRLETLRLKAEAEAAAAKAKAEAEAREKKLAAELAEERRIAAEKEAAAKAEREEAHRKAQVEAEKARKEREAIEAKAKAEREKLEAEAAEERRKAAAAAAVEAEKRAAAEAEAKALRDAEAKRVADEAKRIADEKTAADAKAKADALAAKKAAAAPDKAKFMHFADIVRHLDVPLATSEAGQDVAAEIGAKVENFAKWIEAQAATL